MAERLGLHDPFGRRVGPADIDAVDADAVEAVSVRGIAGEHRQRALGRRIDGELGRAAMRIDRQDVDDGAALAPLAHRRDRALHEEERRARIDVEQFCPERRARRPGTSRGR